ncbi:diguanylate cyclase [Aromatoleum toluvorans]|uniref:diguanylate cyclase n=1 Tax=Aromatoleum toluvorans TaxID=92002 RepID=UPI001B7D2463|nr:diguanylate cyclase [Aromatoleum toluvorans]
MHDRDFMGAATPPSNAAGSDRFTFDAARPRLALAALLAIPLAASAQGSGNADADGLLTNLPVTLFYAGFAAALLLYSLLQFARNRDRDYLEYAGFAFGTGLGHVAVGIAHGFAPDVQADNWATVAEPAGLALAGVSAAMFTREFLRTSTLVPRIDIALKTFAALFGIAFAGVFALPDSYPDTLVAGIGPAFALLAIGCGLHCRQLRAPGATLLVAGWSAMLVAAVLYLLAHSGALRAEGLTTHVMQFASALGMLTLALALDERTGANWRERAMRYADEIASLEHTIEALQASEQLLTQGMARRSLEIDALTERLQEGEQRFQETSHFDPLTGLANQLLLTDRIDQAIIRAKRHNTRTGVVLLDLDEFTAINDTYGREIGDELLKTVAQRLRSTVREQDTVARPENDQFVIVLEEVYDIDDLQRVANAATTAIGEVVLVKEQTFVLDAAMGCALSSNDACNATTLLKQAGKLMRRAKEGKRLHHRDGAHGIRQA